MDRVQTLIAAWDTAHWEFSLAFEGLSDEDLWKRAHPRLLSVGELAAHVAFGESQLPQPMTQSPLADSRASYYLHQVEDPMTLDLTVEQVLHELKKVHEAAKQAVLEVENLDTTVHWRDDWTWADCLQYMAAIHVAYHCGQAFSVRHLMGHETNDN